jgi:hypothetical protein
MLDKSYKLVPLQKLARDVIKMLIVNMQASWRKSRPEMVNISTTPP